MTLPMPFTLPDWLPWWVPILVLIPCLLYALAFLFMPFGVIGVKGRLEGIEARLDEIQAEIRSLSLRLPEPMHGATFDDLTSYVGPERPIRMEPAITRPPIPPAPHYPDSGPIEEARAPRSAGAAPDRAGDRTARRAEPRLDWPR
jgi:hypothetical protein